MFNVLSIVWVSSVLAVVFPWVGLQYVIVVFPDHTHLLFELTRMDNMTIQMCKRVRCHQILARYFFKFCFYFILLFFLYSGPSNLFGFDAIRKQL